MPALKAQPQQNYCCYQRYVVGGLVDLSKIHLQKGSCFQKNRAVSERSLTDWLGSTAKYFQQGHHNGAHTACDQLINLFH